MSEKPLHGPRLNQAIRDYVKQYILEQRLRPGSSLPPQGQLAEELGVGRSSIREAIRALQSLGIVEVRQGDGLYVREYNFDPILENVSYGIRFDGNVLLEFQQVRVWLESAVMVDAMDKLTDQDLTKMEEVLRVWAEAVKAGTADVRCANSLDRQFHQIIYSAVGNQMLAKLLDVFHEAYAEFAGAFVNTPQVPLEHHQAMLAAIKARDAEALRRTIVQNLGLAMEQFRTAMDAASEGDASPYYDVGTRPFKRPALSEAIFSYVKQYIIDSGLSAGDPLPPEAQLAQDLGVGRSSVREAIRALESLGIVEVRHGDGLYVREYNFDPILEILSYGMRFDAGTLLQLLQIRNWLETAVIEEVVAKIGAPEIASMEKVIQTWHEGIMSGITDIRYHAEQDRQFHRALYTTLHCETFIRFLEVFWIALAEFVGNYRSEPMVALSDHAAILNAVKVRDPGLAREALVRNLRRNEQNIRLAMESAQAV